MNPNRLRLFLIIYIGVLTALPSRAQSDSLLYRSASTEVKAEETGELRLAVDGMAFVRNNEYKSELVKGYTLPGFRLTPTLSYQPLEKLRIEAGAALLHYWGASRYPAERYGAVPELTGQPSSRGFHAVPVFRANMQLTPTFNVVVGTLYGQADHGLAEPLYNDERNLTADPETGVQFLWELPWLKLDAWVDWESFIFKNDEGQEKFTFGLSTRFRPSRRTARAQWYIPVQAVFRHVGGEINYALEERGIKTWLNAATGAGVDIPLRTRIPVRLNFEGTLAYFSQQAGTALPYESGYGLYAKASAQVWRFGLSAGYWHCKDFISILGNPLFGAMGTDAEPLTMDKPRMLTARAEYVQELGRGFAWGVHADVFHQSAADVLSPEGGRTAGQSSLNFAAGICVRLSPSFLLKRF